MTRASSGRQHHHKTLRAARPPLQLEVGDSIERLILALPSLLPELKTLTFIAYAPSPGVEERLQGVMGWTLLRRAQLMMALASRAPLWDVLTGHMASGNEGRRLVTELVRHDSATEANQQFEVDVSMLTPDWISRTVEALGPTGVLGICSRSRGTDGSVRHIPMMDFKAKPSEASLRTVCRLLGQLSDRRGVVVHSGKSYHYYGLETIAPDEWTALMGRFLLLTPFTDARYIAHRLIAGTGVLRISAGGSKPTQPTIAAVL